MKLGLEGKVAVITGPAKGMGAAITQAFAAEGCRLALVGRDTAAIEPVAAEVRASGGEAVVIACDLTDADQATAMARAAAVLLVGASTFW
jgi:short-subunit dehydrogenase